MICEYCERCQRNGTDHAPTCPHAIAEAEYRQNPAGGLVAQAIARDILAQQSALAQQSQGQGLTGQVAAMLLQNTIDQDIAQQRAVLGPIASASSVAADHIAENAQLRARVAELEAARPLQPYPDPEANALRVHVADLEDGLERCEEDLRRKREECERLECLATELRNSLEASRLLRTTDQATIVSLTRQLTNLRRSFK